MNVQALSWCVPVFLITAVASFGFTAEPEQRQISDSPSIEGTYKLISRKLADKTTVSGPDIVGLMTFTKTHRNFNLAWKDSDGKQHSFSIVSTYKLSAKEYSETMLLMISNDGTGSEGIKYTMTESTQTVPITIDEGRIAFRMPFDPVTAVFDGRKFTGTNEGVFADQWEKVD